MLGARAVSANAPYCCTETDRHGSQSAMLCIHRHPHAGGCRGTELPGELELLMVRRWLPPNMRCASVGVRNKAVVLLTRLLRRIRVAVQAALQDACCSSPGALGTPCPCCSPCCGWPPLFDMGSTCLPMTPCDYVLCLKLRAF